MMFIFLGVILFAALSFAVSQMMRGGESPRIVGEQKAQLLATEMMGYGQSMKEAVQYVKINNGCADSQISFENPVESGYEPASPVSDSCKVFNGAGGGLAWQTPPADMNDGTPWLITGAHPVSGVGSSEMVTRCVFQAGQARRDCVELTLVLGGIADDLCAFINKGQGVASNGALPEEDGMALGEPSEKFIGTFSDSSDDFSGLVYGDGFELQGRPVGCFKNVTATPTRNFFYYTLLAR